MRCPHRTMLTCNYSTNPNFSFAQNSQRNWFLYTNFNFLIHFQPDHACLWYFKLLLSDLSMDISCFKYQRYKDEIIGIWASNQFIIKKFFHFWTIFKYFNLIYKSINQFTFSIPAWIWMFLERLFSSRHVLSISRVIS